MSLESLFKPLQWADEQVLRYYTKKTEEWEEKGRSKYPLAHICNLTGTAANMAFMLQGDLYFGIGAGFLALQSVDFARNYVGTIRTKKKPIEEWMYQLELRPIPVRIKKRK